MPQEPLRVALVEGEQYPLARPGLDAFEAQTGRRVEIRYQAPVDDLVGHLLEHLRAGDGYDLVSLAAEYTPAFVEDPDGPLLKPLDELLPAGELQAFMPDCLAECRSGDALYQLPRRREPRLLYYRSDLFDDRREQEWFRQAGGGAELRPPDSWEEAAVVAQHFSRPGQRSGFAFPGSGPGLFRTFCEVVAGVGGTPFMPDGGLNFHTRAGEWALNLLADLHLKWQAIPADTPDLRQSDVSERFRLGRVVMAADAPATGRLLTDPTFSSVAGWHGVALLPGLTRGRRAAWASVATYAIPASCRDFEGAVQLLTYLTGEMVLTAEAAEGALPAHTDVSAATRAGLRPGTLAHRRTGLAEAAWAQGALRPPRRVDWPAVVERASHALAQALQGVISTDEALQHAAG